MGIRGVMVMGVVGRDEGAKSSRIPEEKPIFAGGSHSLSTVFSFRIPNLFLAGVSGRVRCPNGGCAGVAVAGAMQGRLLALADRCGVEPRRPRSPGPARAAMPERRGMRCRWWMRRRPDARVRRPKIRCQFADPMGGGRFVRCRVAAGDPGGKPGTSVTKMVGVCIRIRLFFCSVSQVM